MKKLSYLAAAAAISGLALAVTPASASPLASGLTGNTPLVDEGLVQKAHGWHCRWRRGHRHRRACYDNDYYYGGFPFAFGAPFFAFSFFDDDDHHHWGGHRRHGKFGRHFGHRKFKRRGGHRKWKRRNW
jgi:hypothetical protein